MRGQDPERDGLDIPDLALAGRAAGRQVNGDPQVAARPSEVRKVCGSSARFPVIVTVIMHASWARAGRSGRRGGGLQGRVRAPSRLSAESAGKGRERIPVRPGRPKNVLQRSDLGKRSWLAPG